jgi:microcystin-dependent protein
MTNPGGGITRPVIPPRASAGLSEAMTQEINPSAVLRRWGIIKGIRSNGTVDVNVAGTDVIGVRRLASYNPTFDERVQIDVVGTDMVVTGATAPSPKNQNWRTATVTAIATNGTLTLKFDDNSVLPGVTRLASYNPIVNDVVQVEQSGSGGTYVVVGPVLYSSTVTQQAFLRRPTGDIEISIRKTAKPGTLLLDGSPVSRTDYANLFRWVQDQGLLGTTTTPNLFGPGNGTTTFTLPDFRGRVLSGADATNPLGKAFGALTTARTSSASITTANLPNHTHTVSDHPGHTHPLSGTANSDGFHNHTAGQTSFIQHITDHGGHASGKIGSNAGPGTGWTFPDFYGNEYSSQHDHDAPNTDSGGTHSHSLSGTAGNNTAQTHTVQSSGGSATPTPVSMNVDQPSYSVNYLIWI